MIMLDAMMTISNFSYLNLNRLCPQKTIMKKMAVPFVRKLKSVIRSILLQFFEKMRELQRALDRTNNQIWGLSNRLEKIEAGNARLHGLEEDYGRLRRGLGDDRVK